MNHTILPDARHFVRRRTIYSFACAALLVAQPLRAQARGWIEGRITSSDGNPLAAATVALVGSDLQAVSGSGGHYVLGPVAAGVHQFRTSALGYRAGATDVTVVAGDTVRVDFTLETRPLSLTGIDVSVLRPTLRPQAELQGRQAREANPRDVGDLPRKLPGVSSVRRGSLGLDPVVRGLLQGRLPVGAGPGAGRAGPGDSTPARRLQPPLGAPRSALQRGSHRPHRRRPGARGHGPR